MTNDSRVLPGIGGDHPEAEMEAVDQLGDGLKPDQRPGELSRVFRVLTNERRVFRVLTNERRVLGVLTDERTVLPEVRTHGGQHQPVTRDTPGVSMVRVTIAAEYNVSVLRALPH